MSKNIENCMQKWPMIFDHCFHYFEKLNGLISCKIPQMMYVKEKSTKCERLNMSCKVVESFWFMMAESIVSHSTVSNKLYFVRQNIKKMRYLIPNKQACMQGIKYSLFPMS